MRLKVLSIILAMLLAACIAPNPSPDQDICTDHRILRELQVRDARYAPAKSACKSFTMPFRENQRTVDVQVARLRSGWFSSMDVQMERWESFARLPDGELMNLGWFPALEFNYPAARAHAHKAAGVGNECPVNSCMTMLFTPILEKRIQRLCITYEMKLPYTGSFAECPIAEIVPGAVGVADGAVLWPKSKEQVCEQVRADAGMDCGDDFARPPTAELRADPDGKLFYAVTIDFGRQMSTGKCRNFLYRFEPMSGEAMLIEKSGCV